jgi:hypothetical protein
LIGSTYKIPIKISNFVRKITTRKFIFNEIQTLFWGEASKLILKNTIINKMLTYTSETSTLTNRDRKQLNIFERKVYRRILDPVGENEKEN